MQGFSRMVWEREARERQTIAVVSHTHLPQRHMEGWVCGTEPHPCVYMRTSIGDGVTGIWYCHWAGLDLCLGQVGNKTQHSFIDSTGHLLDKQVKVWMELMNHVTKWNANLLTHEGPIIMLEFISETRQWGITKWEMCRLPLLCLKWDCDTDVEPHQGWCLV